MIGIAIRIAHWLRVRAFRLLRVHTHGAKVIGFDERGRLLLVRQRYGRRDRWSLPGGGVGRGETPAAAAERELREETGCAIAELVAMGRFERDDRGWRDTVHLFSGRISGEPVADGVEIAEARLFALDTLPALTGATRRRLAEHGGERPVSRRW